jgi:hypothetical protein
VGHRPTAGDHGRCRPGRVDPARTAIFLPSCVMMISQLLFVQVLMVGIHGQPLEVVSHGLERN